MVELSSWAKFEIKQNYIPNIISKERPITAVKEVTKEVIVEKIVLPRIFLETLDVAGLKSTASSIGFKIPPEVVEKQDIINLLEANKFVKDL